MIQANVTHFWAFFLGKKKAIEGKFPLSITALLLGLWSFCGCEHAPSPFSLTRIDTQTTATLRYLAPAPNGDVTYIGGGDTVACLFRYAHGDSATQISTPLLAALHSGVWQRGIFFSGNEEGQCLQTANGSTWHVNRVRQPWEYVRSIAAAADGGLLAAVGNTTWGDGSLLRSTDKGATWQAVFSGENALSAIAFSGETGYACGYGIILKSTDNGKTWLPTAAKGDYFSSLALLGRDTVFAAGRNGGLLRSVDGGTTWQLLRNANFRGGSWYGIAARANRLVVVGAQGAAAYSVDGGTHWQPLAVGVSSDLLAVSFIATNRFFVSGKNGVLIQILFQ